MMDRMKQKFDLKQELINKGKDILDAGKKTAKIPGLTYQIINNLAKGKMKLNMELTGTEEPLNKIGDYLKYVMLIVIACVLFLGCCILCMTDFQPKLENGMPLVAVAGMVFAVALGIFAIKKLWHK